MKKSLLIPALFFLKASFGQDTISEIKVEEHFRDTRIINLQSVESLSPGTLEFKISHRFGAITEGPRNLFGLDIATMRMSLEQGITENLMLGIGRSTTQKTYDGFVKWRIVNQKENGFPLTISCLTALSVNGTEPDKSKQTYFSDKLAFINQLIFSSKINDQISLQISPTHIHKNLVPLVSDKNDSYALGFAGTYNFTQNFSFNAEYIARVKNLASNSTYTNYYNSFSCGVGIKTRGHFFELHLSNSMPMYERGFITETNDSWLKGNIHPGFNLVRDFKLYKKK